MKILGYIFIIVFTQATFAQEFEGIYSGDLFSKNNVISLKVKGNAVTGALFINSKDKHDLHVQVKGLELAGTLDYPPGIWMIKAVQVSDSLNVTVSNGPDIKQALFVRITRNPNKNIERIMESLSRDQRLIGKWALKSIENPDGTHKTMDKRIVGWTREFIQDGTCYNHLPSLSEQFKGSKTTLPPTKWNTEDAYLILIDQYSEVRIKYEIRGDTLITGSTVEKNIFVKVK